MNYIINFFEIFEHAPLAVLFLSITLGFLLGKLRIGPVELGGVCGTLIVALCLGYLTKYQLDDKIREVFFSFFLFAMGYIGGPGFFSSFNRKSASYILLPVIEAVSVTLIVLGSAYFFEFDSGMAAGLVAGAATESAIIGTATGQLTRMGMSEENLAIAHANISTAYALSYTIGLLTIVLFCTHIAPKILGIDLKKACKEIEEEMGDEQEIIPKPILHSSDKLSHNSSMNLQLTSLTGLCAGLLFGMFIGSLTFVFHNIPFSMGASGGVLISGLICGWINSKNKNFIHIPLPALQVMRDIGLAVFIACIGIKTGPDAMGVVSDYGILIPILGVFVSLVPACLSLWVGHKFLKIKGPLLIGAIAGQHVSTPSVSAVVNVSKSSVPIFGYTITYAIANAILPALGPIIIALGPYPG